jgi:tetratricopeptide (TPR) repeat protein
MFLIFLLLFAAAPAAAPAEEALPEWFLPLREAVYEQQLTAKEIESLYRDTVDIAKSAPVSAEQRYILLSRCEYMMGRAYQYEERKSEAASRYSDGISYAEKALEINESAQAWQMLAENISQSCAVRSVSYAMSNGLKVEKYAKNALVIDAQNAAAQIMIAARWVYAPSPFHNYKKGIEMMSAIPDESVMQKDDTFNVYLGIGYAYLQQKNKTQARTWITKALEVYPSNKYARSLLAGI